MNTAIEIAAKRGKTGTALSAIERQKKARAALVEERKRESATSPDPPNKSAHRRGAPRGDRGGAYPVRGGDAGRNTDNPVAHRLSYCAVIRWQSH